MASKATTDAIQKDWKEREMIEVVHLNILKVRVIAPPFPNVVPPCLSQAAEAVHSRQKLN